jgi:hypothetical protein
MSSENLSACLREICWFSAAATNGGDGIGGGFGVGIGSLFGNTDPSSATIAGSTLNSNAAEGGAGGSGDNGVSGRLASNL